MSFTKNDYILIFQFFCLSITLVRAFHQLLKIFQNIFPLISLQNAQKLLFYNESCSKVANKTEPFFGVVLKIICKLHNKNKISKQFYGVTNEAK